ncbi:UpxY family transcription antiterminator [uncultured Parabacteroides sp.]|uniref:UpxY family transcription antiterminator n=1 Tax=uncultured Parabacteroides sp. TaxID=512312 RepID=UPI002628D266|nr:UpxY family transcription antiterminator [uncultured Parabacteroides sp.]
MEKKAPLKMSFWFVARTIAHAELNMRKYFEDHNIECFVPTKIEMLKRKGEIREVEVPIIHNLIFFKADYLLANNVFNLNSQKLYRIRDKKGLLYVPEQQMTPFMRFIQENYKKVKILDSCYVVGDKMMIKKGPFAGMIGKVILIDNKNYFTVSLDGLLVAAVKFPKSYLVKVEDAEKKNSTKNYNF